MRKIRPLSMISKKADSMPAPINSLLYDVDESLNSSHSFASSESFRTVNLYVMAPSKHLLRSSHSRSESSLTKFKDSHGYDIMIENKKDSTRYNGQASSSVDDGQPVLKAPRRVRSIGDFFKDLLPKKTYIFFLILVVLTSISLMCVIDSLFTIGFIAGLISINVIVRANLMLSKIEKIKVYVPPADLRVLKKAEPRPNIPLYANEARSNKDGVFQGWINLYNSQHYCPSTYHLNRTVTCHCSINGFKLLIRKPMDEISRKVIWWESRHRVKCFSTEVAVDIRNYTVSLEPPVLSRFQTFSRRFPIVLTNSTNSDSFTSISSFTQEYTARSVPDAPNKIILFARANREKEEWYRRLAELSLGHPITTSVDILQSRVVMEQKGAVPRAPTQKRKPIDMSKSEADFITQREKFRAKTLSDKTQMDILTDYMQSMIKILDKPVIKTSDIRGSQADEKLSIRGINTKRKSTLSKIESSSKKSIDPEMLFQHVKQNTDSDIMWMNALLHRLYFDLIQEEKRKKGIIRKLQQVLDKISNPYYIGALTVSSFDVSKDLPVIQHISPPRIHDDGLWFDTVSSYSGEISVTIETRINMNLLRKETPKNSNLTLSPPIPNPLIAAASSSDEADYYSGTGSNTSTEVAVKDTIHSPLSSDPKRGEHKVTKIFNRLKNSKYFQKLASTKIGKTALNKISTLPIRLNATLSYVSGQFCFHIAPPPSQSIWYGFRGEPTVILKVNPIVGDKSLDMFKLSSVIEKVMMEEFTASLVIPNMESIPLPLMMSMHPLSYGSKKESAGEYYSFNDNNEPAAGRSYSLLSDSSIDSGTPV